jgi:serine/threonine protein kinase
VNLGYAEIVENKLIDGRYRYQRTLGEGATGAVILVTDETLSNKLLALKILFPHLLNNDNSIVRFRSETRVTMSLSHPNIVQTFGMGRHKDAFYYLKMEYCDGKTLRSILETHPDGIPLKQSIVILRDVAAALHYAHSRGIIHRDLKPENILVTTDSLARLVDFGLAQSFQDTNRVTAVGSVLGTPNYMSPEQLRAELLDLRCDIYSFGILAFELLTGTRPFEENSLFELAEAQLHKEIPSLEGSQLPVWLIDIIESCTQKKKYKRPDDLEEILLELEEHAERKTTPIVNQSAPRQRSDSTILEHQSSTWEFLRKFTMPGLRISGFVLFLSVIFLAPHLNASARWRYLVGTVTIEKHIGREFPLARLLSNAPSDHSYPQSLFGPSEEIKRQLREKGLQLSKEYDERIYFRPYLRAGYSPDYYDPIRGTYPTHYFADSAKPNVVHEFLEYGANPNLIDKFGFTALDYASQRSTPEVRTLDTLLAHGADPTIFSEGNEAPLVRIILNGQLSALNSILRSPLNDPNIKDKFGNPAIFAAISTGNTDILRSMIQHGANVSAKDNLGRDVLSYSRSIAFMPDREKVEKILIKAISEVESSNSSTKVSD